MASRTYSARDLLQLRHFPLKLDVGRKLYEKLKIDPDLCEIIRIPSDRSLSLILEEENAISAKADSELVSHRASASQLDGTEAEWKYRGRTDSEHAEGQPISAPSGPSAQKDEGFQRFYKAVVSPTHVRVTAGGRIVPNTRGSSSPTGKWIKERTPGDGAPGSRPQSSGQPESVPYPTTQGQFGNFASMMSGYASAMAPRMASGVNPYQFVPAPVGYNMNGAYAVPPAAFNQFQAPRPVTDQPNNSANSDKQTEAGVVEKPNPLPISPPEQFDISRPFFYNGQWVMPQGQHFYPPYGMLPSHSYPATSMNGAVAASYGNAFNSMGHQVASKLVQPVQPRTSQGLSVPATLPASSESPPISSIRPSEITKKQIEALRGSLRYLEDQLQYNRHQIDEKGVEHQAQLVRHQIQHFEKNLETQLTFEGTHYPKTERPQEETTSASTTSQGIPSRTPATSEGESDLPVQKGSVPRHEKVRPATIKSKPSKIKITSRPLSGLNSSKSVSAFGTAKFTAELPRENTERLRKVSSLPTHAALAPPFQPRKEVNTSTESTADSSIASGYEAEYPSATESTVPKKGSEWKTFFKNAHPSVGFGAPYLVGELPRGIRSEAARDTDYTYSRDLTEDELRARHMYWGKTPRHLQKGLPKFDGKDFYPPSPVKGQCPDVSSYSDAPSRRVPVGNAGIGHVLQAPKTESDPFNSMVESGPAVLRNRIGDATQSESLPRFDQAMIDDASEIPRPESCVSQVSPSYEGFRQALEEKTRALSDSSHSKSSSDEGEEDKNLIFRGRQAMSRTVDKPGVWQNMMRNGKSSANAVPVKVSPMTAQGVLPNYAGHATASLTPAIANTTSFRGSSTKFGETSETRSANVAGRKRGENRPPGDSLGDTLRDVNLQDNGHRGFVSR